MSSSSDESPSNDSPPAPSDSGSKSSKDSPSSDEGSSKNSSKDSPSGSNDSSGSKDVSSQQSDNNNGDNNNNNNGNNGNNNNNNGDNGNKNGNNNNGNNENNNGNTSDNGNNNNNNNNNDNNNGNNGNNNNNGNNGNNNNNNNGNNPSFTPPTNLGNHQVPLAPPNSNKGSGNKQVANKAHSKSSSDKGTVGGIHTNTIIGVAVAAGFVLLLLLVTIICCCRKKKKKAHRQVMYYEDHNGGGYNNYQNNYQQSPWVNNQKVPEHVVKVPPPGGGGNGGWGPNSQVYSGEASSNFSGLHQPPPPPMPHASPSFNLGFNQSTFTYEELVAATNGFSQANLLGQGGFGYVHKGVFPNGKEVAIKSLKSGSGQGEREFAAEVEIISRVHHRYLVSLVGYCIAGGQRMLVYEYVPNKTLEYHLHGKGRPVMDFPTRLRIALGSSKGLAYLHEDCHPRIIHRDIKAANILLDNNFDAMVADFGLAKLSTDNNTHVSTRVMGTFGYLAPEYASSGKLTEKSDVFSFGVMLLELITGKQPVDISMDDSLVDWARPILTKALEDGNFDELVDPRLEKNYNHNEMQRMIACAAASIRHSARKRPKMSQISRILEGDSSLDDLNEGTKPGQSAIYGASGEYNASTYNADMEKFRQLALGSQEFESNEFGRSSGENSREMGPAGVQK